MEFKLTSQVSHSGGVKALIYAQAGMGKTVLVATAPKPILLSAESGLLSLSPQNLVRIFGPDAPGVTYDIPVLEIKTKEELIAAYVWVKANIGKGIFETVCLDSISEVAEIVLNNLKAKHKDPRQAYGELLDQMSQIVRDFRDLQGCNVYMSAKLESFKNEMTGGIKYGPAMPGLKLGPLLPYMFDEVFRLATATDNKGNPYRYLQTQPDILYEAKDRSGALDISEAPHLTYIFNKIRG